MNQHIMKESHLKLHRGTIPQRKKSLGDINFKQIRQKISKTAKQFLKDLCRE